jgi:hypothetical protein
VIAQDHKTARCCAVSRASSLLRVAQALPCRWQQTDSGWQRPLIITTARKLAEAEGWDAVTTRRLSSQIEYSQPVL